MTVAFEILFQRPVKRNSVIIPISYLLSLSFVQHCDWNVRDGKFVPGTVED